MYDIEEVIKHRKPMRLVDKLISFDNEKACVHVHISAESEFFQAEKQGVPSYIGIEYMAQCIAAQAGANDLDSGEELKLGFLLGTRKYKTYVTHFSKGTTLVVNVSKLMVGEDGLSVFDCTIQNAQEETILAEAKVNVFQPENSDNYLKNSQ